MSQKENKLILYKDDEGKLSVNQTTQENISMHISNIYADGELDKDGTYKKFLLVRQGI